MNIEILAIGDKLPSWVRQGIQEYQQRLPAQLSLTIRSIPPAKRFKSTSPAQCREQERQALAKLCPARHRLIATAVKGKPLTTEDLAEALRQAQQNGENWCIIVGGPDGIAPQLLQQAEHLWSLSAMTLPHSLARLVLVEQLYRAWTVSIGHPYHRA